MRVLVLDDNPDDRRLVLRELSAVYPDAVATEVLNEAELTAELARGAPDLFITDLHARWINGVDVLRRVKRQHPATPVIMFTGTGSEEIAVTAMHEGLDDYVVKSARQLPRLRASIRQAVEGAESKRLLRQREAELEAVLAHKEVLLQELHHRVKNNLQTVTSLLWMRAKRANDPRVAAELNEVAQRMSALAGVQARILNADGLDKVDFRSVLEDIAGSLADIYREKSVTITHRFGGELVVGISRAMPLALLTYEILLNSFKHAFDTDQGGSLTIELRSAGGVTEILIADDGRGYDEALVRVGVGSRLVRGLAAEARVEIVRTSAPDGGTSVVLRLI